MPELPEVETIVRSLRPLLVGSVLEEAVFHRPDIRWPIPVPEFKKALEGQPIQTVERRSKYMLWNNKSSVGIFHLGMTGRFTISDTAAPTLPHTHASFNFTGPAAPFWIHYVDPRRFGIIDWDKRNHLLEHKLFRDLGPEPLANKTLGQHLFQLSRGRILDIKSFIMDAKTVVGVGNIYASESLFLAKIRPTKAAGKVTEAQFEALAVSIQSVLEKSIRAGGTTFRDFRHTSGETGYFAQQLAVYDREGEPCLVCQKTILCIRQKGRATYYCAICQKA